MMRTLALILSAGLLATAASAVRPADDPARLDKLLAGRTAGKPVDCLPPGGSSDSQTIGSTIVYRMGGTYYVNRFLDGCPSLRNDRVLISTHPTGRICRGDIAQVALQQPPGMTVGSCAFGDFTPYRRPDKKAR
jgi:hypothetical protein